MRLLCLGLWQWITFERRDRWRVASEVKVLAPPHLLLPTKLSIHSLDLHGSRLIAREAERELISTTALDNLAASMGLHGIFHHIDGGIVRRHMDVPIPRQGPQHLLWLPSAAVVAGGAAQLEDLHVVGRVALEARDCAVGLLSSCRNLTCRIPPATHQGAIEVSAADAHLPGLEDAIVGQSRTPGDGEVLLIGLYDADAPWWLGGCSSVH